MIVHMATSPVWPAKEWTDNEVILDFIRQQERAKMEIAIQERDERAGVPGVRQRLADVMDSAERIAGFPDKVLTLLRIAYDDLWEETRE